MCLKGSKCAPQKVVRTTSIYKVTNESLLHDPRWSLLSQSCGANLKLTPATREKLARWLSEMSVRLFTYYVDNWVSRFGLVTDWVVSGWMAGWLTDERFAAFLMRISQSARGWGWLAGDNTERPVLLIIYVSDQGVKIHSWVVFLTQSHKERQTSALNKLLRVQLMTDGHFAWQKVTPQKASGVRPHKEPSGGTRWKYLLELIGTDEQRTGEEEVGESCKSKPLSCSRLTANDDDNKPANYTQTYTLRNTCIVISSKSTR